MKVERAELLRLEERLSKGELPEDACPVLLETVRHFLRCRYRRGASTSTTERRAKRRKRKGKAKNKGHGRNGAKDYTGAKREAVPHGELKAGGPCPEPLCQGKLYDTHAPNKDVELKAQPPVQATVYERQVLRCAGCQKTFAAPLPPEAGTSKYMDPDERLAFYQQHSRPIMDALYKWIEEQFRERVVEPNSRLGKAFSYVKNHWQGLTLFLEVPGVPLDNNVRNMSTTLGHSRAAFSEPRLWWGDS